MNTEENSAMSAEQAADFAALSNQSIAPEVEAAPGTAAAPDLATELGGLITIAVKTLSPLLPSLAEVYTEETISTASGAIAGVCNKHGWIQGGMFGEFGEEIAAAFVLVPLAIATNQGVRQDIARSKAKTIGHTATLTNQSTMAGLDQKSVIIGSPVATE